MFMKRLLFIYNPHAGKELLKPKLADVIDIFVKAGYEVVAYPTQAYRDAYKKIKKYDSNEYDLVVCSGGDGTLDEVVTGMMKRDRDKRDPIGYIPTGTTNDFASSLHIPRGLLEAADNAVESMRLAEDRLPDRLLQVPLFCQRIVIYSTSMIRSSFLRQREKNSMMSSWSVR